MEMREKGIPSVEGLSCNLQAMFPARSSWLAGTSLVLSGGMIHNLRGTASE